MNSDPVLERWRTLVKKMGRGGYVQLQKISLTRTVTRLKNKNYKVKTLSILGRWRVLIRGVLERGSPQVQARWVRIVVRLRQQGILQLPMFGSLNTRNLINKLKQSQGSSVMKRWRILVKGLLAESDTRPVWANMVHGA